MHDTIFSNAKKKEKIVNFKQSGTITDAGTMTAKFASYDPVPDSYGDVCAPYFLADSVEKRLKAGKTFPLCYHHDLTWIVGAVDNIEERADGCYCTAHFFDTPKAQEVREYVKSGAVHQMSFAYNIKEQGLITLKDGTKANQLRKCDLIEISITANPAQPLCVIESIKGKPDAWENMKERTIREADQQRTLSRAKDILQRNGAK